MVATAALPFLWTALAHLVVSTVTSCHEDLVYHPQFYQSAAILSWSTHCAQLAGLSTGHQDMLEAQVLSKAGLKRRDWGSGGWGGAQPHGGALNSASSCVLTQDSLPLPPRPQQVFGPVSSQHMRPRVGNELKLFLREAWSHDLSRDCQRRRYSDSPWKAIPWENLAPPPPPHSHPDS